MWQKPVLLQVTLQLGNRNNGDVRTLSYFFFRNSTLNRQDRDIEQHNIPVLDICGHVKPSLDVWV